MNTKNLAYWYLLIGAIYGLTDEVTLWITLTFCWNQEAIVKAKLQSEQMSLPFIEREKPLILLSLQPQYWDMILEGAKKYEYRRLFRKDAVNAYIYVSTPRKEIVGFVEFAEPIIDSPENIASFAEKQRPGSQKPMLDYMKNCDVGYAIPILSYEAIKPLSLKILRDYFPNFTAPQSYIVLDNNPQLLDFIKSFHRGNV